MSQFSNENDDVFLIKLQRMIDRGALISRYSRTSNPDIRDLYRKEFEKDESRGADFYKRVFLEYGDESVAELVTAQVGLQNVTNIATKVLEEGRIGLSFIEKSSRYVRYDKKANGRYLFASAEKIGLNRSLAELYEDHCNALFETYSDFYNLIREEIREEYPIGKFAFKDSSDGKQKPFGELKEESDLKIAEKSYESSVRAKALDEIRFLLPASTLTNMGISGNGRAFISLLQRLHHYGLPETVKLSDSLFRELEGEFPEIIDASFSKHGQEMLDYLARKDAASRVELDGGSSLPLVKLVSHDEELSAINRILSLSGFSETGDLPGAMEKIESMPVGEKISLIHQLGKVRENRRHKPGRAFESTSYTFQVTTNYGAFRDFQRHRFISVIRGDLSTKYGYDIPELIYMHPDMSERYVNMMELTKKVYKGIYNKDGPRMAQYIVPYAYRYPVAATMNFRELTYFIELRSTPQAHEDLRRIAVSMYNEVKKVHPDLVQVIKFLDSTTYPLGRVAAESRKEERIRNLDENMGGSNPN